MGKQANHFTIPVHVLPTALYIEAVKQFFKSHKTLQLLVEHRNHIKSQLWRLLSLDLGQ